MDDRQTEWKRCAVSPVQRVDDRDRRGHHCRVGGCKSRRLDRRAGIAIIQHLGIVPIIADDFASDIENLGKVSDLQLLRSLIPSPSFSRLEQRHPASFRNLDLTEVAKHSQNYSEGNLRYEPRLYCCSLYCQHHGASTDGSVAMIVHSRIGTKASRPIRIVHFSGGSLCTSVAAHRLSWELEHICQRSSLSVVHFFRRRLQFQQPVRVRTRLEATSGRGPASISASPHITSICIGACRATVLDAILGFPFAREKGMFYRRRHLA